MPAPRAQVKGNLICDICKHPIGNLPEIDPAIVAAREEARRRRQPLFAIHPEPTTADYVFDAVRVAWVTIICCILFVDGLSVSRTFLIGATVGVAYCWLSMVLQHVYRRWRDARRAAALARQQQQQAQQSFGGQVPVAGTGAAGAVLVRGAQAQTVEGPAAAGGHGGRVHSDALLTPLLIPGEAEADSIV